MYNFDNQYNNPFSHYNDNKTAIDFETLQKARQDLIGELEAIIGYEAHLHTATNELAKQTWKDIKEEELTHVGELLGLLDYIDSTQKQFVQKGFKEFMERMNQR